MKFSDNGYYLEEYVKCDNCGVLIYNVPLTVKIDGKGKRFCSDWCIDWHMKREADLRQEEHKG